MHIVTKDEERIFKAQEHVSTPAIKVAEFNELVPKIECPLIVGALNLVGPYRSSHLQV